LKTIKRILIVFDFSKPWSPGFYIKKGFEKNGIDVSVFDPATSRNVYADLIRTVNYSSPDMLLYIKNYYLQPEWLVEIKKKGLMLVQWYIDSVIPEWVQAFLRVPDFFFTMSEGLVEEFKREGAKNVFYLSQAFEPSFFEVDKITEADRRIYSADVTFAGSLGSKPYYLPRRKNLERIIKEGVKFKWWGPRLPRKFSTVPLILGKLGRAYGGKFIWGKEFAKVACLSKIFIAFDAMPHIRKSMSARMYTAVGCGAFYMCRHVDGIEEILEPGREIVTFRSEGEMIDMIRYYLENDDLRMRIAAAGKKRVMKEHTYEARIKQMLRIIANAT
jgi:spore maturation protein CgeB